mmetsp:Transcript_5459/g.10397  ORF Transcript_5459/g.10397 Transcript_5459/m.10397 type:complete len:264 (+) Transcript_5459:1299-2090(+)
MHMKMEQDCLSSTSWTDKPTNVQYNSMVSPPIQWKEEGITTKILRKMRAKMNWDKTLEILEKEVLVWSGCMTMIMKKDNHKSSYGHGIPIFKARGIISQMSTQQLLQLFIDSTKVKLYNKHSNGRKDVFNIHCRNGLVTKVVESQTKVPFSNKIISMTTMLHARKITDSENDFILVSRSVERANFCHAKEDGTNEESLPGSRNEIHWGINVIRQVPGYKDKVDLTTITQANSGVIPGFLVHKLGVKCVIEFINNVRVVPFSEK